MNKLRNHISIKTPTEMKITSHHTPFLLVIHQAMQESMGLRSFPRGSLLHERNHGLHGIHASSTFENYKDRTRPSALDCEGQYSSIKVKLKARLSHTMNELLLGWKVMRPKGEAVQETDLNYYYLFSQTQHFSSQLGGVMWTEQRELL
jgi:hypothetical protein